MSDILHIMKVMPPASIPILRSQAQAKILTALSLEPEREFTLSELASRADTSLPTAAREVARAEESGLVETRSVGRSKLVKINTSSYIYEPLRDLLLRTLGPAALIAEEFRNMGGIDSLFVFGSWAARYSGHRGPPPGDIDILVVGRPDRDEVYDAAERIQRQLQFPVQVTIRTTEQWNDPDADPFLDEVRRRPLVEIDRPETNAAT